MLATDPTARRRCYHSRDPRRDVQSHPRSRATSTPATHRITRDVPGSSAPPRRRSRSTVASPNRVSLPHTIIAHQRAPHGSGLGRQRWVVERTLSWLHQHRRLRLRYERRADIHEAGSTTIVPASDYVSGRWASERDVELRHERRAPGGGPRWRRTRVHPADPLLPVVNRYARFVNQAHPGPHAPLGWTQTVDLLRAWITDQVGSRSGRSPEFLRYATSLSLTASARARSFFRLWFSICRMRSRVTLNVRPTSSSVLGFSPSSP